MPTRSVAHDAVKPIGLGARDSLRLEAGLPLYGHDLDLETTPVMAGLTFAINKRRRAEGGFPGAMRILAELENGPPQKRVGFDVEGRQPVREGALILDDEGNEVGRITSGGFSPSLQRPIAMGYVARHLADAGTALKLEQRGKLFDARVAADAFRPPPLSPQGSRLMTCYFTRDHEWIRVEGDIATVGISNHAQEQLGDIVFAEVPEPADASARATKPRWSNRSRRRPTSTRRSRGEVDRRQSGARRRSGADQQRPRRRGLVLQAQADRSGRARRADGRSRLSRLGDRRFERSRRLDQQVGRGRLCPRRRVSCRLGGAALDLLDPQPGERILDVGCGDGTLTQKIVERGATCVGIDNSPEMIAAARAKGLDARLCDAADMHSSPSSTRPFPMRRCTGCSTRSRRRARSSAR